MLKTKHSNLVEICTSFFVLGCTAFGGPMAHIAYFRQTFVLQKHWLSESDFAQLLSLCQLLPGPASSQLGFAIGLVRAGWLGAIMAFVSFTLPSVILLMLFATSLPLLDQSLSSVLLSSLKLVAIVVVADAVIGMFAKFCTSVSTRVIAIIALLFILLSSLPFASITVIVMGGLIGYWFCHSATPQAQPLSLAIPYSKTLASLCLSFFACLLIWSLWSQPSSAILSLAQHFYQVGAMVFGGGHVVLPLLAEATVSQGLISEHDFLAGYGAAQALPGPLFSVAAYFGGIGIEGPGWAWSAALSATFAIFLPGFLLIAGVLPCWQSVMNHQAMQAVTSGINAAVVGLLAAIWCNPLLTTGITHWRDIAISLAGYFLLKQKYPMLGIILLIIIAKAGFSFVAHL